jgi:hypothetical protein
VGQNVTPESREIALPWQPAFLSALREVGVVRDACEAAGVSRTTAYRQRNEDPEFAREWDESIQDAADLLEREAVRRARVGVKKPVIYQGKLCGVWVDGDGNAVAEGTPGARMIPLSVTEYSDTLLMFLLKGIRPEKYKDHQPADVNELLGELLRDAIRGDIRHSPPPGGPTQQPGQAGGEGHSPDVEDSAAHRPD